MRDFISNGIVQSVLATLIVAFLLWVISTIHAISSAVNLTQDRGNKVCSKSRRIRRNQKEKESWISDEVKR